RAGRATPVAGPSLRTATSPPRRRRPAPDARPATAPSAAGLLDHALNRGNNRAPVPFGADDFRAFLRALSQTQGCPSTAEPTWPPAATSPTRRPSCRPATPAGAARPEAKGARPVARLPDRRRPHRRGQPPARHRPRDARPDGGVPPEPLEGEATQAGGA